MRLVCRVMDLSQEAVESTRAFGWSPLQLKPFIWNSVPDSFLFCGLMSDDDWGFDAAIEDEMSFMQEDELQRDRSLAAGFDGGCTGPPSPAAAASADSADAIAELDEPMPSAVLPEAADDTVSSSPRVRRVKVRGKTTTPYPVPWPRAAAPVIVEAEAPGEPSKAADLSWWVDMDEEAKRQWVDNAMKAGGFQEYVVHQKADHRRIPPRYYSKCNRHDRRQMALRWIDAGSGKATDAPVREWITDHFNKPLEIRKSSEEHIYQGKQFLLTCNGNWGLLTMPEHVSLSPELEEAVEQLKAMDASEKAWLRVRQETMRLVEHFSADDWAVCLELCPKTFATGTVRLHAHVSLQWNQRQKWRLSDSDMIFLDGKYSVQSEDAMCRRRKIGWQSYYYVVAPKTTQLFVLATKEKFVDFTVNPHWIWNLVQSRKMSTHKARDELVASANRLTAHLPNIDKLMTELAAVELREKINRKEALFARQRQPFKRIRPVELLVADLEVPRERRKFLVLDGPSRTGKTQFIMSLFGRESTLEVNAADEESPALQTFDYKKHRCVLLDEAPPSMVLRNRKVFQCPNAMVTLGQSKTNCHSYSIYLNETLIAIASNEWQENVEALSRASRDWIEANQVYIKVTRPLWVAPVAPS